MSKSRHILLLRHAKSSWADPISSDFTRPLNERGKRDAPVMGEKLRELGLPIQLILCSTAVRTQETYKGLGDVVENIPVSFEESIYEASVDNLLNVLRGVDDQITHVLMIGHNPGMQRLAQLLSDGQGDAKALTHMAHKFPTSALAILKTDVPSWDELGQGSCHLQDFTYPAGAD